MTKGDMNYRDEEMDFRYRSKKCTLEAVVV